MSVYHPDWVGIGLSLLIGTRIWPQQDRRKRVMFIAVAIGVALAVADKQVKSMTRLANSNCSEKCPGRPHLGAAATAKALVPRGMQKTD